jgi:hypothetical protein
MVETTGRASKGNEKEWRERQKELLPLFWRGMDRDWRGREEWEGREGRAGEEIGIWIGEGKGEGKGNERVEEVEGKIKYEGK